MVSDGEREMTGYYLANITTNNIARPFRNAITFFVLSTIPTIQTIILYDIFISKMQCHCKNNHVLFDYLTDEWGKKNCRDTNNIPLRSIIKTNLTYVYRDKERGEKRRIIWRIGIVS